MSETTNAKPFETVYRTPVNAMLTVSTVRVGRSYETAILVAGKVCEPRRTTTKSAAGYEHDAAVEFARAYTIGAVDHRSARHAYWTRELSDVLVEVACLEVAS